MAYTNTATSTTRWFVGGENASAECLQRDECEWELGSYMLLREATREAEDHVIATGHPVQVERAQFRIINPVEQNARHGRASCG